MKKEKRVRNDHKLSNKRGKIQLLDLSFGTSKVWGKKTSCTEPAWGKDPLYSHERRKILRFLSPEAIKRAT